MLLNIQDIEERAKEESRRFRSAQRAWLQLVMRKGPIDIRDARRLLEDDGHSDIDIHVNLFYLEDEKRIKVRNGKDVVLAHQAKLKA